jgi:hypothetical protein
MRFAMRRFANKSSGTTTAYFTVTPSHFTCTIEHLLPLLLSSRFNFMHSRHLLCLLLLTDVVNALYYQFPSLLAYINYFLLACFFVFFLACLLDIAISARKGTIS